MESLQRRQSDIAANTTIEPMNFKTAIMALTFFVVLGAIVVGQQLKIRSTGYEVGKLENELRRLEEENRVKNVELARKRDPVALLKAAKEMDLHLVPPEEAGPAVQR